MPYSAKILKGSNRIVNPLPLKKGRSGAFGSLQSGPESLRKARLAQPWEKTYHEGTMTEFPTEPT
jgi:hypothetical protein